MKQKSEIEKELAYLRSPKARRDGLTTEEIKAKIEFAEWVLGDEKERTQHAHLVQAISEIAYRPQRKQGASPRESELAKALELALERLR